MNNSISNILCENKNINKDSKINSSPSRVVTHKSPPIDLSSNERLIKRTLKKGSEFSKAIVEKLNVLELDYGKKLPTIKFISDSKITAFYDAETESINVSKNFTNDLDMVWDNVLFEYCNFLNHDDIVKISKLKNAGSEATPNQIGELLAIKEFDSSNKYVTFLKEIILNKNISEDTLPKNAQQVLNAYKKYESLDEKDLESTFINSPHDSNSSELKQTLPTKDLYAYETVETWGDMKYLRSRIIKILIKSEQLNGTDCYYNIKNRLLVDEEWPKDINSEKRPHVYSQLIDKSIKKINFPDNTAIEKLKNLHLSPTSKEVAKKYYDKK